MVTEGKSIQRNDVLSFGKYKGKTILEVLYEDPQYLVWANNNVDEFFLNDALFLEATKLAEEIKISYDGPDWGDLNF